MCTNGFEGYHRNSGRRIKPRSMIRLKRFSEILMIPYRLHNSQVESLSKCEKKKNRVDRNQANSYILKIRNLVLKYEPQRLNDSSVII